MINVLASVCILGAIGVIVFIIAPFILFGGWIAMLGLRALAHIFGVTALAVGYWQSLLVALILAVLV